MANYTIINGELYHASKLANQSAGNTEIPNMSKIRTMLKKHIAIQEGRSLTDFEISNVKITNDNLTCTIRFYDDPKSYFYGMSLAYLLNNGELKHYGVLGMKWGIRRYQNEDGTLTDKGKKRQEKGKKKQAKIVKKQDSLRKDNEYRKEVIKKSQMQKRALESEKLSTTLTKQKLDRDIATDNFLTKWGKRRAQDKSFFMNARLHEIEELNLAEQSKIASALEQMDINNTTISKLDQKYARIGRRFLLDK